MQDRNRTSLGPEEEDEVVADDLARVGTCLGSEHSLLSAEHLGTVVSELAKAASAAGSATMGKSAEPIRVLPEVMLRQNSFRKISEESFAG